MPARLRTFLLLLAVFSPGIFTVNLVVEKAVDVAIWDEWETAPLLAKWHDGKLAWSDLYAAQIQHRIVVPRLITILLANLSGGDFRWNVYACIAFVVVNAMLLWGLLNRTLPGSPWRWPLMFAFNLLLFCPMHYETLLWGSSMWGGVPVPCLLGTLLVLSPGIDKAAALPSGRASWARFCVALLLAEVATHSFAHGIAIWPVVLLVLATSPWTGPPRTRLLQCGAWLAAGGLTLWAYFTNFINVAFHAYHLKPGDHAMKGASSLLEGDNFAKAVEFVLGFIGGWFARSPFGGHPLERAVMLGVVTLGLWSLIVCFAVVAPAMRRHRAALLPWISLGAYALLVGLMLSKRAADTGVYRAVMARYLAPSQYLLVSGMAVGALTGATLLQSSAARWRRWWPAPASGPAMPQGAIALSGAVLLAGFCVAQIPRWEYGLHLLEAAHRGRRHAQALMLLLPHLREQKKLISMKPLCKSFDYCLNAIHELQRIGLMHTPLLPSPELRWFRADAGPLARERADVTQASFLEDGTVELAGFARFGAEAPADLILVTQAGRIIGIGQPAPRHVLRLFALDFDMTNLEEVPYQSIYPWRGRLSTALIPNPGAPLELWALQVKERRVARLDRTVALDVPARRVSLD